MQIACGIAIGVFRQFIEAIIGNQVTHAGEPVTHNGEPVTW